MAFTRVIVGSFRSGTDEYFSDHTSSTGRVIRVAELRHGRNRLRHSRRVVK
jgi:hypothetical protein